MTLLTLILTALSMCAVGMVAANADPPADPPDPAAPPEGDPASDDTPKSLEDALKRWPHLRKDLAPRVQAALNERLKNKPPAAPAIPDEVKAQLAELEELRVAKQKAEDEKKSELQRQIETNAAIKAEADKRTRAEKERADKAEAALDSFRLESEIVGYLSAKNKGMGIKWVPALVRDQFTKVDGKFFAKDPETGAPVGVSEFMEAFLRQPDAAPFLPPPAPGSGVTGGGRAGRPGTPTAADLTPEAAMALAIQRQMGRVPSAIPQANPEPPPVEPPPVNTGS